MTWTGLPKDQWPTFLDGRDLSPDWTNPVGQTVGSEVINIEFWGTAVIEGALIVPNATGNSYKTLRIVGPNYGYLYSQWCTNETDFYDTVVSPPSSSNITHITILQNDPYELTRITPSAQPALANRLNGILLATKTCVQDSCRNPWGYLHPSGNVSSLQDALNPAYDSFYASLPRVSFNQCLQFQSPSNEQPYFPGFNTTAAYAFAQQYRNATDKLGSAQYPGQDDAVHVIPSEGFYGDVYQDLATIEQDSRVLTDAELQPQTPGARRKRWYSDLEDEVLS